MKGLDATQVDQLRQISEYLSYQREQQGISLETIANQTYIPLRVLRALDSFQFDQLPEPVYIRGFIRRYADALGLDGREIADAFPVEPVISEPSPAEVAESEVQSQPVTYESRRENRRLEKSPFSVRPLMIAGIGAAVLLGAIALAALNHFLNRPRGVPEVATSPTTELPSDSTQIPGQSSSPASPDAATVPSPEASPSPSGKIPANSAQADVSLTGRSWMQVVADGKTAYEGTLGEGEQRTWKAQKKLVITAGNAGVVVLSCNQGEAKPLGKTGEVVDATCLTAARSSN